MISKVSTFLGPSGLFHGGGSATPSLVLSLDAANSLSYGGYGATWSDLTIFHNDAIFFPFISESRNPTFSQSGSGSFEFSYNDKFVLNNFQDFPIGDSKYTIEVWFNPDNLDQIGVLTGYGDVVENDSNVLQLSNKRLYVDWSLNPLYSSTQSFVPGNWYYATTTYDGVDRKIYLNGSLIGSDTPGVTNSVSSAANFSIGNFLYQQFQGKISIVKVHNKALGVNKFLANFNSLKQRFGWTFGSMTFNGTNSYLTSSSSEYIIGTNDFTLEAYFISSTHSNYSGIVSQRQVGNFNPSINMQLGNTSTPLIEFCAGSSFLTFSASHNEWYHVAISRTGLTSSFFVNGDLFTEISDTSDYTPSDLVVGRYYTEYNGYYFNGLISNVRFINGVGLYTGTFSIPQIQLSATASTKLLIVSQQTTPTSDVTDYLQSVTASNIGWTSSLPSFYEFNYPDFSSTDGLELVSIDSITGNSIYLTNTGSSQTGNVYRSQAIRFDRSFSFNWSFQCSGGSGADGFCVQWTTTNNTNGVQGGNVGTILDSSTINAFQFQTYINNRIVWLQSNNNQGQQNLSLNIRQNVYYWMDYNYNTSTIYISYATTNTKPVSPQHTFTGVTFDSSNYYIGVGAATGGSTDNHILKSMNLTFV